MMLVVLWMVLIRTSESIASYNCVNNEDCLYKSLFKNYNRNVRPVIDTNMTVDVTVSLVLNSLSDIEEKNEVMITVGFFKTVWFDEFLTWDPQHYGGLEYLTLRADLLWLPDIAISNSASKFYDVTYKRDFHIHLSSNGRVRWSFGGVFTTNCNINLKKYPFDIQSCYIEIENWMYTVNDVNLSLPVKNQVLTSQLGPNAVWSISNAKAIRNLKYESFASIKFMLVWQRKTLYYYVNIVIPIVLMLIVALGVFWLPAECGEKMSLAITIVLAFSVFQIIIMENTPVNSDVVPAITELVMLVMALATTSLLSSMLAVFISSKSAKTSAPNWLRKLCFKYLAKLLYMHKGIPVLKIEEQRINSMEDYKTENRISNGGLVHNYLADDYHTNEMMLTIQQEALDFLKPGNRYHKNRYFRSQSLMHGVPMSNHNDHLFELSSSVISIKNMMEEKDCLDSVKDEWKYIAMIIDRIVFWITLLVLTTSLIYIFYD